MTFVQEFLRGCYSLGVKVTREEVNLVWPLFDLVIYLLSCCLFSQMSLFQDHSGGVNVEEFIQFMVRGSAQGQDKEVYKANREFRNEASMRTTNTQRKLRIQRKSRLSEMLVDITLRMRQAVLGYAEQKNCTPEEVSSDFLP